MHVGLRIVFVLIAITADCPLRSECLSAQPGVVQGFVRDSATGGPVADALLWAAPRVGRIRSGQDGRFVLDGVFAGLVRIQIHCPSHTMLGLSAKDTTVSLGKNGPLTVNLLIAARRCDEPSPGTRRVVVDGAYQSGFEDSQFTPCRSSRAVFDERGDRPHLQSAWLEWDTTKPNIKRHVARLQRAGYVRGTGRLMGPGQYGHMGVSPYLLVLDSVVSIRDTPPSQC